MVNFLVEQAALFNVQLTAQHERRFERYARELSEWNTRINLTGISDPQGVRVRHFLDSLSVANAITLKAGMRLIDVGTGAGFPGLPLAIVHSQVHVTLLEATGKKVAFLDHIIKALKLVNARTLQTRAEEAGQNPQHREQYDLVLARAVARLPALLEYLLPLVRVGGYCIAMKGRSAAEEAESAGRALEILGGRLGGIQTVQLPGVAEPHYMVVVEKIAATPAAYPRKPGLPIRKPLA